VIGHDGLTSVVSVAAAKHSYPTAYSRSAWRRTWLVTLSMERSYGLTKMSASPVRQIAVWPVM
jgi:hypothetical protein